MKITMTSISKRQCALFIYPKEQNKLWYVYINKKLDTSQIERQCMFHFTYKKQDTLRCAIFNENCEFGIYIQESWHFSLRDVFIYKNTDTHGFWVVWDVGPTVG